MDVASRERWPRVETLFAAAMELGAEGREAYLEQTCRSSSSTTCCRSDLATARHSNR